MNTKQVELIGDEVLTVKRGDDDFIYVKKDTRDVIFSTISYLVILHDGAIDSDTKSFIREKISYLINMVVYGFREE